MTRSVRSVQDSFRWCHLLTQRTARNFAYAFQVLPRHQRRAMEVLYAFMRVTDDLGDEEAPLEQKRQQLQAWRTGLDQILQGEDRHPVHPALRYILKRYAIPLVYLQDVITGVESDLERSRINTFAELYRYCYQVASAVGLACIPIWGYHDPIALPYAEAAGIAFQLTNILRDLNEDAERDRIYLPTEEWQRFACPPESWPQMLPPFREMMAFQVERARFYYKQGANLQKYLSPEGRAVFSAMCGIYGGLLNEIETRQYDVFSCRVRLRTRQKIGCLLKSFPVKWGWL